MHLFGRYHLNLANTLVWLRPRLRNSWRGKPVWTREIWFIGFADWHFGRVEREDEIRWHCGPFILTRLFTHYERWARRP